MSRNIISGRYGSVQRLLPFTKSDGSTGWYAFNNGSDEDVRNGDYESKNGQGTQPTSSFEAASLIDRGSLLLEEKDEANAPYASTVSAVTSWSLENQASAIPYTASNTRGYKGKLEGIHSASGNIAGIGAVPPIAPGQRFRFYGYVGPDNGKLDNYKGTVYRITAIANSVQIQINYQLQNPCTWTVGWQSDWKEPGDELWANRLNSESSDLLCYGFWDYTTLDCSNLLPSSKECLWLEGVDKPICLLDANIQFNTETSQFTNSCSSSVGGWQSCVVGPTDCTVSTNIHGDNYGDLYSADSVARYYDPDGSTSYNSLKTSEQMRKFWAGSNHAMRIHVGNNGAYWEFYKLMITGFGGLNVDTTSNNPVQFSCNMEFNAFPQVAGSCTPGYIIYNNGAVYDNGQYIAQDSWKNFALVDLRTDAQNHATAIGTDRRDGNLYTGNTEVLTKAQVDKNNEIKFEKWVASCAGSGQEGGDGYFCGDDKKSSADTAQKFGV